MLGEMDIWKRRMTMKICSKCGKEIIYGINGCQMMNECFECHGGFPQYAKATGRYVKVISEDELDAMEDRCLRDEEV